MRPSLQHGVFISDADNNDIENLEKIKFVFKHQMMPIWTGIGGIAYGTAAHLGRYLFPASDEIASAAYEITNHQDNA